MKATLVDKDENFTCAIGGKAKPVLYLYPTKKTSLALAIHIL